MVTDNIELAGRACYACLNPYCNGRWSLTLLTMWASWRDKGLNPYCNGRWSLTLTLKSEIEEYEKVLILIVMEDGH